MPGDRFDHLFVAPASFDSSLAFYRDTLGWHPTATWGGNGEPRGAVLDGGGVQMVIAEQHPTGDHSWTHGFVAHQPTVHLAVDDLDARYAAVSASAAVVVKPETTHWGTRWFVLRDPDGNLIAYEQAASR